MSKKETIEVLVEGGAATAAPPLGPALGPMGVNTQQVVDAINEKTREFKGMNIPVKVIIDPSTKAFEIEIGSPPASSLIKKELGLEKGTGDGKIVGDLSFEQAVKITKMKQESLLGKDLKSNVKEIIGVCQTIGVSIDGKTAKEITKEINDGSYDDTLD